MKWTKWIKDYPKLEEIWNMIQEPAKTLFEQQIDNYAQDVANKLPIHDISGRYSIVGTSFHTGAKREFKFSSEEDWNWFKKEHRVRFSDWTFDFDNVKNW